ncbi:MAG TPA: sigma-70 family RNA polymerase sigma factor [Pedobacter sp.]|nr:sigma-70 family RNA polymerase sigma factor [Pedobacter sp.]
MSTKSNFSEKELVVSLRNGSNKAFVVLYDQYKRQLAGSLFKLLKSEDLTFEVLQELFLKIWDNRAQIDPEKSFKSYLFKIAVNLVNDYYRKAARDKMMRDKMMVLSTEIYTHIEEQVFRRENIELLHEAIDLMPPQRKRVFTLFKLEGKSYKEIEELLGVNEKTINSHLYQANRFLKKYFLSKPGRELVILLWGILS